MTGNFLIDLLISLAGVGLLVAVSYFLGGWRSAQVDEAAARERLSFDEPDFNAASWLIGVDGRAAAAISERGDEFAFVFALGDGLATRRAPRNAAKIRAEGAGVIVLLGDDSKSKIDLRAPDAAAAKAWAAALGVEERRLDV